MNSKVIFLLAGSRQDATGLFSGLVLSWDKVTLLPYQGVPLPQLEQCPVSHLILAILCCQCQRGPLVASVVMVWVLILIPR